jgi:hypothetical protein
MNISHINPLPNEARTPALEAHPPRALSDFPKAPLLHLLLLLIDYARKPLV